MAELNKDVVKKISELCRIGCTDQEIESLLEDLRQILGYVEQLKEVDTENVMPCNHVLKDMVNVMREDDATESMPRKTFLSNAPEQVSGLIKVPTVIKKKD
ncbi:MAG: Aspartyl/glutamyl-tRNA(Asn/Gln) amidotransferase subunit C [Chlamydiae bacterium]|nr:Aspartyl/glutamyl-tRNA(Asn/Gln) amidotransferase subunit C [Chlamydiota bacterium]